VVNTALRLLHIIVKKVIGSSLKSEEKVILIRALKFLRCNARINNMLTFAVLVV